MGKKVKTGKARKDKFYKLAKETGYRARSAFKLLQLNRKFEFLPKSRVCIDLCAAPGGWLQVAANQMPVSSVIVGVDLVPIKPIPNCVTLTEDITTEKCRVALRKELQTWKADCVLNDGAPNVGKNWLFDAYAQAELTLYALKLATEFLRKGGWFVTKVFRSKDYHALMWVLNQLFKKVHATKPQASRNESAEIFVVCQGFIAPDKLDPKFLDPRHVFKDVEQTTSGQAINLFHPDKTTKPKAEGYAEGDYTLRNIINDTEFLFADNYLEVLARCTEICFVDDFVKNHRLTTFEIKQCCKDVKLLGKKELRTVITWRKKLLPELKEHTAKLAAGEDGGASDGSEAEEEAMEVGADDNDDVSGDDSDNEENVKEKLAELQEEENKEVKRKLRRAAREKRKLRDKMALNMIIPGDTIQQTDDIALFNLKKIKSKNQLQNVESRKMPNAAELDSDDDVGEQLPKHMKYNKHELNEDLDMTDDEEDDVMDDDDDSLEMESEPEEEGEDAAEDVKDEKKQNPLLISMESQSSATMRKMNMWFKKDVFEGLEEDDDEDLEIERMTQDYTERGGVVIEKEKTEAAPATKKGVKRKATTAAEDDADSGVGDNSVDEDDEVSDYDDAILTKKQKAKQKKRMEKEKLKAETKPSNDKDDSGDDDDEGGDTDVDALSSSDDSSDESGEDEYRSLSASNLTSSKQLRRERKKETLNKAHKDGFEIVSTETAAKKVRKLDPVGLALGEEMIKSAKRRREIIDASFNRHTFNDDGLPDWFVTEEKKHTKRNMPVTKEQIQTYKEKLRHIDAAPIKKVAEAKARKKKKLNRRLEKARKKAEVISDTVDVTDKEKLKQMKDIYKRAGLLKAKKENVTYVVAKRGAGKRVSRPAGVKGRFKVVDPRMKKDLRNQGKNTKGGKGAKGGRGGGGGGGKGKKGGKR